MALDVCASICELSRVVVVLPVIIMVAFGVSQKGNRIPICNLMWLIILRFSTFSMNHLPFFQGSADAAAIVQ